MPDHPPATVIVYVAKWTAILIAALAVGPIDALAIAALIAIPVLLVALWRGKRVAWALALFLEAAILLSTPVTTPPVWVPALTVAALALLLAPATRRFAGATER